MLTSSVLMYLPVCIFLILVYIGREELGIKWILLLIAICGGLLLGFWALEWPMYFFVAIQAVIDIILVIVTFGGIV